MSDKNNIIKFPGQGDSPREVLDDALDELDDKVKGLLILTMRETVNDKGEPMQALDFKIGGSNKLTDNEVLWLIERFKHIYMNAIDDLEAEHYEGT